MRRILILLLLGGSAAVVAWVIASQRAAPQPTEATPPTSGRLDKTCRREAPDSRLVWCRDPNGAFRRILVADLTDAERTYLERLEETRQRSAFDAGDHDP